MALECPAFRAATLLLLVPLASSAVLIRVDSRIQGRTFVVDTDRPEIRKSLQEAAAPPAAGAVPDWLPPYPGATLVNRPSSNQPPNFSHASYRTSAPPDAVFAHYEAAVRTARVAVTYVNRRPGSGGALQADDGMRTAVVSVSPGPGPTDIGINWNLKTVKAQLPASARLEAVSYDDDTDILRLRNPATRKEYVLDGAAMLNYSHSTPLQAAARNDFPAWVVAYPGAKIRVAAGPPAGWQPRTVTDMKSFMIEMDTPATVAEVAAFYRDTMSRNSLGIERETDTHPRAYSLEARSPDRMHQVYLEVQRQSNSTLVRLLDHYTTPRR